MAAKRSKPTSNSRPNKSGRKTPEYPPLPLSDDDRLINVILDEMAEERAQLVAREKELMLTRRQLGLIP